MVLNCSTCLATLHLIPHAVRNDKGEGWVLLDANLALVPYGTRILYGPARET